VEEGDGTIKVGVGLWGQVAPSQGSLEATQSSRMEGQSGR